MTESLLRELKEQVEEGQKAEAIKTIDELQEAFEADRAEMERHDLVATGLRYQSAGDSEPVTVADEFVQVATELDERRVKLNEAILGYLADEGDPKTLVTRIDETLEAYEKVASKREELHEHTDDVHLGVLLRVAEIDPIRVPKGAPVDIETTLENLGSDTETGITIETETEGQISVAVSPETIGSLSPDEQTTLTVTVDGDSTDSGRIRVSAEGDIARESTQFPVEVLDKAAYLTEARNITERLQADLAERKSTPGRGNSGQGLSNRLEEVYRRLNMIIERIESGRGNETEINNRIESVVNRFESVDNMLTNGEADRFDEAVTAEYVALTEDAIDRLEASLEASV